MCVIHVAMIGMSERMTEVREQGENEQPSTSQLARYPLRSGRGAQYTQMSLTMGTVWEPNSCKQGDFWQYPVNLASLIVSSVERRGRCNTGTYG